jgi:hypothetical protein
VLENVGDGVGLFAGTGHVSLERVSISKSARSQVLIDEGAEGINVAPDVRVDGGKHLVVIQRTAVSVDVPPALVTPSPEILGVDAPILRLP